VRCRQYPPALARARCAWVQHPAEAETWLCGERRKIRSRSEEEAAFWSLLSAPPLLDACDPRGRNQDPHPDAFRASLLSQCTERMSHKQVEQHSEFSRLSRSSHSPF